MNAPRLAHPDRAKYKRRKPAAVECQLCHRKLIEGRCPARCFTGASYVFAVPRCTCPPRVLLEAPGTTACSLCGTGVSVVSARSIAEALTLADAGEELRAA